MLYLLRCSDSVDTSLPNLEDLSDADRDGLHLLPGEQLTTLNLPGLPGRRDLKFLDPLPSRFVTGRTPSLADIAAQPDVAHQGAPRPDPHPIAERVRVIVRGTDAALSRVVSKLMRIDALWVEVGYVPVNTTGTGSTVALSWGLDTAAPPMRLLRQAISAPAQPTALIRDDHGIVTLGAAEITASEVGAPMIGEVIVNSEVLYRQESAESATRANPFNDGVRLVATPDAPGLAAVQRPPLGWDASKKPGLLARLARRGGPEPTVLRGRALQAGGEDLRIIRDGDAHPRPLSSVTFYRHLRDGQFVRN